MWFKIQDKHAMVYIVAKPNAKKTAIIKITEQALHIAIHAKPHKGEANKELVLFLSKIFAVPKSMLSLKTGEHSKYKQLIMPLTAHTQEILNELEASLSTSKNI